mmetsp:Transcript_5260/g.9329  ORF Transcript_5260/g.9329 Transcript_5260/m.9329 type:complete len:107 (-) Transcript_5260:13-333(-)
MKQPSVNSLLGSVMLKIMLVWNMLYISCPCRLPQCGLFKNSSSRILGGRKKEDTTFCALQELVQKLHSSAIFEQHTGHSFLEKRGNLSPFSPTASTSGEIFFKRIL